MGELFHVMSTLWKKHWNNMTEQYILDSLKRMYPGHIFEKIVSKNTFILGNYICTRCKQTLDLSNRYGLFLDLILNHVMRRL